MATTRLDQLPAPKFVRTQDPALTAALENLGAESYTAHRLVCRFWSLAPSTSPSLYYFSGYCLLSALPPDHATLVFPSYIMSSYCLLISLSLLLFLLGSLKVIRFFVQYLNTNSFTIRNMLPPNTST